ncbi:helix-turn-helix domain-containing protein [Halomonas sp. KO116]|uniref:helix-turn-helix domain-containing protein n=1 Tax=Halomonas sp. KO116 TaxID=1504981 RepID=UPI0004E3DA38|nr:helix-turn-helix domain-containing protein [Halomonas sp. KO116]AJY49986.1 transcriptional regulator, IclR family [Halomonas sp. KO116]
MKSNRSIERCLLIFQTFRINPNPTASELARLTELPRATVLRFLYTLEKEGYAAQDHERWRLTAKTLEIGFAALGSANINEFVQSSLGALANDFAGTANIGELTEDRVTIIARAVASPQVRRLHITNLRVGSTLPSDSALYQALSPSPPNDYGRKFYENVNQISLAVPLPNIKSRLLSLGISVSRDALPDEKSINNAVEIIRSEAQRIGHIMSIDPVY